MKFEMDLLRDDVPVPEKNPDGTPTTLTVMACRKVANLAAQELINDALLINQLSALKELSAQLMVVTAGNLIRLDAGEPELEDFVYACAELVSTTRNSIDKALQARNIGEARLASVMMEIVIRGICYCTDTNYEEEFKKAAANVEGTI